MTAVRRSAVRRALLCFAAQCRSAAALHCQRGSAAAHSSELAAAACSTEVTVRSAMRCDAMQINDAVTLTDVVAVLHSLNSKTFFGTPDAPTFGINVPLAPLVQPLARGHLFACDNRARLAESVCLFGLRLGCEGRLCRPAPVDALHAAGKAVSIAHMYKRIWAHTAECRNISAVRSTRP